MSSVSTVAPSRQRRFTVSCTLTSLPGIALAETTTVSLEEIWTAGWSPKAIRVSAERGSPWLPVHRMSVSCGMNSSSRRGFTSRSSGTVA
jgi:hypothetical protein